MKEDSGVTLFEPQIRTTNIGNSLVVQWLALRGLNTRGMNLISGWETQIHKLCCSQTKHKQTKNLIFIEHLLCARPYSN